MPLNDLQCIFSKRYIVFTPSRKNIRNTLALRWYGNGKITSGVAHQLLCAEHMGTRLSPLFNSLNLVTQQQADKIADLLKVRNIVLQSGLKQFKPKIDEENKETKAKN